jgi:hypothetical protein
MSQLHKFDFMYKILMRFPQNLILDMNIEWPSSSIASDHPPFYSIIDNDVKRMKTKKKIKAVCSIYRRTVVRIVNNYYY